MNCPRCGDRIRVGRYDGRCNRCGNTWLQPYAIQCLKRWTFLTYPKASGGVPRDGPTQGYFTSGKGGPYLFACKRRLHNDIYASFSTTLIGSAITQDRKLALFVGPGPYDLNDVWVFDARRVANQASERTTVDSKRERDIAIFDISAKAHGVKLGDHLAGRVNLPGPVDDGPRESTLRAYGVGRGAV